MNRFRYWRIRWWEYRLLHHREAIIAIARRAGSHAATYAETFDRRNAELERNGELPRTTEPHGVTVGLDAAAQKRRIKGSGPVSPN